MPEDIGTREPIRPRFPLYHLAADCQWVEKIRQDLEERHGTCFVAIKMPTGVLIASSSDLRQFYPQLVD